MELFEVVDRVAAAAQKRVPAAELTEAVRQAVTRRPVSVGGAPLTVHSATQVTVFPPTFAIRVNRPDGIHFSYERYLISSLRRAFGFEGSPLRISFRRGQSRSTRPGARRAQR
jgi:GTP-binding protein